MRRIPLALVLVVAAGCSRAEGEWLDVRLDYGPGGDTTGAQSRRPQLCASGPLVYATWADDREGGDGVYFSRSLDGGRTWENADLLISAGATGSATRPAIGCDAGTVAVVWEDDRDGPFGNPGIYARVSDDAGSTWGDETPLTDDAFGDWRSIEPRVAVRGDEVHAVWADGRSGGFDIWYNASTDAGRTWLDLELRLDSDALGAAYSAQPVLALDDAGGVFATWIDRRDVGSDVYFNRSRSRGEPGTWLAEDLRLDVGDAPGASESFAPDLAVGDGTVAVAWHDRRNGDDADIFVAAGDGDSWSDPVRVDGDGGNSLFARLAWDGGFHLVFRDDRSGDYDILATRSDDGLSWSEEVQLDGAAHAESPVLAASGGVLAVAWADHAGDLGDDPREDIYVALSTDDGQSWTQDQANDPLSGPARAVFPSIAVCDGAAVVVWEDWRAGNPDIYARRPSP